MANDKKELKKDNEHLSLDINLLSFLADFNHHVKVIGEKFYKLAKAPKSASVVYNSLCITNETELLCNNEANEKVRLEKG